MYFLYSVCVLFGLLRLYQCAPAIGSNSARILKFDYDDSGKGPYRYGFESSDGISREESGELHYAGTKNEFMKVTGVFSYPGPDGVMYEVRYTADDQGFHPEGDHINVPPFVPWVHYHDDETNEIGDQGLDSGSYETGQVITGVIGTTPKPSTEYLPSSSTTYLPSTSTTYLPSSVTTPKPIYNDNKKQIQDNSGQGNNDEPLCLQILPCRYQEEDEVRSSQGSSRVYLPSTPSSLKPNDSLTQNLLSSPNPNPEIYFHSTASSEDNIKVVTPAPNVDTSMTKKK